MNTSAYDSMLAGQVDLESQSAIVASPLVKDGKLKAFAIIGRKRLACLADPPTMGELGDKKLDIDFWHMLLAPAGTPQPIVDKLNAALRAALADAKVQKTFADDGMDEFPPDEETPKPRPHCSSARSRCGATSSAPTTSRRSSNSALYRTNL